MFRGALRSSGHGARKPQPLLPSRATTAHSARCCTHETVRHRRCRPSLRRDALEFLAGLARKYSPRVTELLERRRAQQARYDAGEKPHFLEETKKVGRGR